MKLVRYIYPTDGNIRIEEARITGVPGKKIICNRIEIFNVHGNLVWVIRELKNLKLLKLQSGFYLVKEKDINGRVLNSRKVIF
ncbi:MAG: hypothetical protein EA408_10455 [Marinilabiliales bacterium]|nr:MAG: hypothetical protein EA408_10455 [Marinilabiliales bacterium]